MRDREGQPGQEAERRADERDDQAGGAAAGSEAGHDGTGADDFTARASAYVNINRRKGSALQKSVKRESNAGETREHSFGQQVTIASTRSDCPGGGTRESDRNTVSIVV